MNIPEGSRATDLPKGKGAAVSPRYVVDRLPVGIYRARARDGAILEANGAFLRLLGVSRVEELGPDPLLTRSLDAGARSKWLARMTQAEDAPRFEGRLRRADGSVVWMLERASAERDADGAVAYYDGVLEDVTARKEAERSLQRRLKFEHTVASISARLLASTHLDETISECLGEMSKISGASRAYLFLMRGDGMMDNTHEWCAPDVDPQIHTLQDLPVDAFPWWMERIGRGEAIHVKDVASLPPEASAEKEILERQNVESILVFPVTVRNRPSGFIGFDNVEHAEAWRGEDLSLLEVASRLVGNALERRRGEEALRMSETRFRLLVDQSPLSTQILAPDGRTLKVNRAWEKLWGVRFDDVSDYNVLHDRQLADIGVMPYIQKAFAGEPSVMPEVEYVPLQGEYAGRPRWVRAHVYPVRNEQGDVREVVLVHEDVTDQKETEVALRMSESKFRRLAESNIVGVMISEHAGRVQEANDAFLQMVGRTRNELEAGAVNCREMTPPSQMGKADRAISEMERTGACAPYETELMHHDGRTVPILIGSALLDGRSETSVSFVLDLTARQAAQAELESSRQQLALSEKLSALGALVSGVAHEIRTPLTYVSNNLFLVERAAQKALEKPQDAEAFLGSLLERAKAAVEGIDRISVLVQNLRGYAQLDRRTRSEADLGEVVAGAVELFRATQRGSIDVEVDLQSAPGLLLDREQIQQVALNLLTNAAEAMQAGGTVRVRTTPVADGAIFEVEDEGTGITPQAAARLWEPFFTTKAEGTGLGLSISKRLAEAHGGNIRYETSPSGTKFTVYLPNPENDQLEADSEAR